MEAKAKDKSALRDEIHALVDQLPDGELSAARRFVEYLRHSGDPFLKKLREAPEEPATEEERAAIEEGRRAVAEGDVISDEELRAELEV